MGSQPIMSAHHEVRFYGLTQVVLVISSYGCGSEFGK